MEKPPRNTRQCETPTKLRAVDLPDNLDELPEVMPGASRCRVCSESFGNRQRGFRSLPAVASQLGAVPRPELDVLEQPSLQHEESLDGRDVTNPVLFQRKLH